MAFVAAFPLLAASASGRQTASATDQYGTSVAAIFRDSCVPCHGAAMMMGKLRLDSEAAILRGGASGPVIVAGHSGDSLLVKRILGVTDAPRMPMGGDPLPAAKIAIVRAWIDRAVFTDTGTSTQDNAPAAQPPPSAASPAFAEKIRPILAARCYGCHGTDVQQNGLRVDSLASLLKGSDSGHVVVPGHSDQSRLMRRLAGEERPLMPYGGPALSASEIGIIRQWIDAGAPGPDATTPVATAKPLRHWAYVKPVVPPIPAVHDEKWVRNPIDAFILARQEKEGLKPSPEADPATLLRRVYLDLTGLPPSPKEVDVFLADKSPDAYEKVVDQLLASPHYGERWARPWLDLARYADSNGYEKDRRRTAWEYRDWVIRALNSDMSFREFTTDQIAGDLLPNPTNDQLIASGFNRNSMLNQEGGIDVDEYYWLSQVDRVNTTASVWLGSTLGCAQCHNHKFDPFTQKDYYRFLAFFGNGDYKIGGNGDHWAIEAELELPTPEQKKRSAEIRQKIDQLQTILDTQTPALTAAERSWETTVAAAEKSWRTLHPTQVQSVGGATLTVQPDSSVLAAGSNPQSDTYTVEARSDGESITAVRLEVLPDASLPHNGPGRDSEGNFFLSDFNLDTDQRVKWKTVEDDDAQDGYEASNLLHLETGLRGWAIDATAPAPVRRQAVLILEQPISLRAGTVLRFTMKHGMRHSVRNIGRFRISVTAAASPMTILQIPAQLRPVLDTARDKRSAAQQERLEAAYRKVASALDDTRKQLADLQKELNNLGIVTAQIMRDKPNYLRPATYIRERGSFLSKGELVYADVPAGLNRLPANTMPNRLGLAEWLVSNENPLTARVTVNHFWETIFGHGIVETSEDFGTQGDPPSHPELLDWLATEFMKNNWSMKQIQRLMVTSATYRQSSKESAESAAHDPYNKLYARGPRFRVEAEMVHDVALSMSGLLSEKMYGPSVFPYQPDGVWDIPYSSEKWIESSGEDRYRRALYTFIRRSAPYPSLVTYDAPSREFCTVRRVRTNTPLQALTSLNDPFFFEAARTMAKRMMREGGTTTADRAVYGFRLAVSRAPSQAEVDRLKAFYLKQLQEYSHDPKAAERTVGTQTSSSGDTQEWAAWTMVANVVMNMDETISKE